jgi:cell division septal protein FtsQ
MTEEAASSVMTHKTWHLHTTHGREFTVQASNEAEALAEFRRLYSAELELGERPIETWIAPEELDE